MGNHPKFLGPLYKVVRNSHLKGFLILRKISMMLMMMMMRMMIMNDETTVQLNDGTTEQVNDGTMEQSCQETTELGNDGLREGRTWECG